MQPWFVVGAIFGALGVALGAFGAHGLPGRLESLGWSAEEVARRVEIFETAVRYQMYHALALLAVGLLHRHQRGSSTLLHSSGAAMTAGVIIFSGLLYVLVFAGPGWRWLGAIVPIGGTLLIVGWTLLALAAWRSA